MRVVCIVCGKTWEKPGESDFVSHGVCCDLCEKVWNDWMDMPSPKSPLRLYYHEALTPNIDRSQLSLFGGKHP